MAILQRSSEQVKHYSYELLQRNHTADNAADETFIYEEDTDPEIFFVTYVWEVVTKVVTSSFLEWKYDSITLFPNDFKEDNNNNSTDTKQQELIMQGTALAQDVTNVV